MARMNAKQKGINKQRGVVNEWLKKLCCSVSNMINHDESKKRSRKKKNTLTTGFPNLVNSLFCVPKLSKISSDLALYIRATLVSG